MPGLLVTTVTQLKQTRAGEIGARGNRSLVAKKYVYVWVAACVSTIRPENGRCNILVLMGDMAEGKK